MNVGIKIGIGICVAALVIGAGVGVYRGLRHETIRVIVDTALAPIKEIKLEPTEKEEKSRATILFVGDIMLDRNVRVKTDRAGDFNHPFALIAPTLAAYDAVVGNLEGPITDTAFDMKRGQAMTFTFDPRFAEPLARHFDAVSLANNHTLNFGEAGLRSTREYLGANGVEYFGDPLNRMGEIGRVVAVGDFRVGLVGYHAFAEPERIAIPRVTAEIARLKREADFVVVMPHWGAEYEPIAHQWQVAAAHQFVDAGADAVIGGHPHVVQNVEEYRGKKIYYSLGNFIFDQYFSDETMRGIMVGVSFERDAAAGAIDVSFTDIPYRINAESQPFVE